MLDLQHRVTGLQGGKMKHLCDVCIIIPSDNVQIIEDLRLCVANAIFAFIRQRLAADIHAKALTGSQAAD
jgi:hypothetical protein